MILTSNHIDDCLLWGQDRPKASFKKTPDDFIVSEILPFTGSGEGEHLYLQIKKTNLNTQDVLSFLSRFYHTHPRNIGYSGLKDKHATTTQYFSVHLPKNYSDATLLESLPSTDDLVTLDAFWHHKKLKVGTHKYNHFEIILKNVCTDFEAIKRKASTLETCGFPNFFGTQRFGHDNLDLLAQLHSGKPLRRKALSFALSSMRAGIFNQVLAARIKSGSDLTGLNGDLLMLSGSNSFYLADPVSSDDKQRLLSGDVSPSAPMIGSLSKTKKRPSSDTLNFEEALLAPYRETYEDIIDKNRLIEERRRLRAKLHQLNIQATDNKIQLAFSLEKGSYATAFLSQLFDLVDD